MVFRYTGLSPSLVRLSRRVLLNSTQLVPRCVTAQRRSSLTTPTMQRLQALSYKIAPTTTHNRFGQIEFVITG